MAQPPAGTDNPSNVVVVVRLRPPENKSENIQEIFIANNTEVTVKDPLSRGRNAHTFTFNRVFQPEHGQEAVFNYVAKPLVEELLKGFNSCCFAYGQTGSGKTHSVFGEGNGDQRGMLARSIEHLFAKIEAQVAHKEVGMVVSFTEIYLDQVRDLGRFFLERKKQGVRQDFAGDISPRSNSPSRTRGAGCEMYPSQDLPIRETPQGIVFVEDLALIPVSNIREVLEVANLGVQMRATFETRLNARSSRSHTIFTISIIQRSRTQAKANVVCSMINFVDLAGSERLARSQSEGRRFQEAVVINSSLSALGKVVLALASDSAHVPYRDSKLTRILQNSLGGNSHTTLLTTIDPSIENYEESLNSLLFADRCRNVLNKPVQNLVETEQGHQKIIHRLRTEIAQLKHQLEVATLLHVARSPTEAASGRASPTSPASRAALPHGILRHTAMTEGGHSVAALHDLVDTVVSHGKLHVSSQALAASGIDRIQEQAIEKLIKERMETAEAEELMELAEKDLEQERMAQIFRNCDRRRKLSVIKGNILELQGEMKKCRSSHQYVEKVAEAETTHVLRTFSEYADQVSENRQQDLHKLVGQGTCSNFEREADIADALVSRWDQEADEVRAKYVADLKAVEEAHRKELESVEKQYAQWEADKIEEAEQLQAELEQYKTRTGMWQQKMHGELLIVHDLVTHLHKLLDELSSGIPESKPPSGIRMPAPTPGPALPAAQLLAAHSVLSHRATHQDLPEPSVPPQLQLELELEKLRPEVAEVRRQMVQYKRSRPPGELGSLSQSSAEGHAWWDASRFARHLCNLCGRDSESLKKAAEGEELGLHRLQAGRLRALCMELRQRARWTQDDIEKAKAKLQEEVALDLVMDQRIEQIRQLERDIITYEERRLIEEERLLQMELALQSCKRALSTSSSLPPPGSRPASALPTQRCR